MKHAILAAAMLLSLGAGSCDSGTGPSLKVALGEPFELRVGEAAAVDDERLTVAFAGVANDSRCPIDAICIVAGDASVRLRLRLLPHPESVVEIKTPESPRTRFDGYEIEVQRLLPAPRAATPTDSKSYVASLVVRRP